MATIDGFKDILIMMITIIGIAYPVIVSILRTSIKANEELGRNTLKVYDKEWGREKEIPDDDRMKERIARAKVLGVYNTMDELIGWQVIAGIWCWSLIVGGSSILLFPELSYGSQDFLMKATVFVFSFLVWLFFAGLMAYSMRSANGQRRNIDRAIGRHFGEKARFVRRMWFFGEWIPKEAYREMLKEKNQRK